MYITKKILTKRLKEIEITIINYKNEKDIRESNYN